MSVKRATVTAMMTCLIVVCSWLTIPTPVPFTMQTFAIFCTLLLLGGRDSLIAIGLYILMGCVGLPVFSGFRGGIGHVMGPTGGFIVGFVLTALWYTIFERVAQKKKAFRILILVSGLMLCYLAGALWFQRVYGAQGTVYSFFSIVTLCVLPYIIPDLLKLALAVLACRQVTKAINGKRSE